MSLLIFLLAFKAWQTPHRHYTPIPAPITDVGMGAYLGHTDCGMVSLVFSPEHSSQHHLHVGHS